MRRSRPPERARDIAARVEFHYTPKHSSWLAQHGRDRDQRLRTRLPLPLVGDLATLERRVIALETERNVGHCSIHWQFTSEQARTKLTDRYLVTQAQLD
jgi:hypothetical protein